MGSASHRSDTVASLARVRGLALACAVLASGLCAASVAPAFAGAPHLEFLALHGPTNVPLKAPVDQQQTITVVGENGARPNVGRFKMELESPAGKTHTTGILPFDATPQEVQTVLEGVGFVGPGNVTVTGGPQPGASAWSYVVTFDGALAGIDFGLIAEGLGSSAKERKELPENEPVEEAEIETEELLEKHGSRDTVVLQMIPTNTSSTPTAGPITVTDTLPNGLSTAETPEGVGWACTPEGEGKAKVTCTYEHVINPDSEATNSLEIHALVNSAALKEGETLVNEPVLSYEVAGEPNPVKVTVKDPITISDTPAEFGIEHFQAGTFNGEGLPDTVAGDHPYAATTSFFLSTVDRFNPEAEEDQVLTPGRLKDADVVLPEGFVGNPAGGRERCPQSVFVNNTKGEPGEVTHIACGPKSQVGIVHIFIEDLGEGSKSDLLEPVYDLEPPRGVPAEFGFTFANLPIRLDAHVVRFQGKYRVTVLSADVNSAYNISGVALTLWGVPADPTHDVERRGENHEEHNVPDPEEPKRPFLTNPADCLVQAQDAPVTLLYYDQWAKQGEQNKDELPELGAKNWLLAQARSEPVTGCNELKFSPEVSLQPRSGAEGGSTQAGAPTGLAFNLKIPQVEEIGKRATPQLEDTRVELPAGVTVSPAAGNGLEACSAQAIDLESSARGNCPAASQIGTVGIVSPLLEEEVVGRVYVGEPECHPCHGPEAAGGQLLKLFIEAEAEKAGVRVKLPGEAAIDQATGQLTTTFLANPQLPFSTLTLKLKDGPRAAVANPQQCGTYTSNVTLVPWSAAAIFQGLEVPGDPVVHESSSFDVNWTGEAASKCPATRGFAPQFKAGTENSTAGAYSHFETIFARASDTEQTFSGVTVHAPPGLLGKINGVTRCEEAEVKALVAESGSCPANSRIATATSSAGPGSEPFVASGPVYLTGPTPDPASPGKTDPFGLAIAVPAKTKAFDLGTVVVRAGIAVDRRTSAITITSEPLPQSIDGIPFGLKQVAVNVDREEFMFNPTNCEAKTVEARLTGAPVLGEAPVTPETLRAPFQASHCAALPFAPRLQASTEGDFSKREGASLTVKVESTHGEANIGKVELQLPLALPSRLETLQKACPVQTFEAGLANVKSYGEAIPGCNPAAKVGSAVARTPLLNSPVQGPAWLVSHAGAEFPDLVFLLEGEGVQIELVGHTKIKAGITYSKFESVPDAPISSFETTFPKGVDAVLGAGANLCEGELKAPTTIISQSNKLFQQDTTITVTKCAPSVTVTKVKRSGNALLVTVKVSHGGRLTISGAGLKTTSTSLASGARQIRVPLTKTGLVAKQHRRRLKFNVTASANGKTAVRAGSVKL